MVLGLDAHVPCRCWQVGLTTAPPFPRELLEFDEGFLSVRADPQRGVDETVRMDRILEDWLEACCAHPWLEACGEWVGNWSMVRTFSGYVDRVDYGQLPTLRGLMPRGNAGQVPPADSARAMLELVLLLGAIRGGTWLVPHRRHHRR